MSCPSQTSPIKLIKNDAKECDMQCEYQPKYKFSSMVVQNEGDYINFEFLGKESEVRFNSELYQPESMRLYKPSLHEYGDGKVYAEFWIRHKEENTGKILYVCIPVTYIASKTQLDNLIMHVKDKAPDKGESTGVRYDTFSLNNIVPQKPYFFYTANNPLVEPCTESVQIIVFNKADSAKTSSNLEFITESSYTVKSDVTYFYNKNGPLAFSTGEQSDDIYIDCQPTGESGNTVEPLPSKNLSQLSDSFVDFFNKHDFFKFLIAVFVGVFIYFIVCKYFKKKILHLKDGVDD